MKRVRLKATVLTLTGFLVWSIAIATGGEPSVGTSCPGNDATDVMVKVGPLCVDKYEASVWDTPLDATATTQYGATRDNYPCSDNGNDCSRTHPIYARSVAGMTPSRHIAWFQAQQACAMSDKRLLTNAEWQMAVAGTPDPGAGGDGVTKCNTSTTGPVDAGSTGNCVSNWGVYDMVGNVWEWVADWIQDNSGRDGGSASSSTYGDDWIGGVDEAHPEADRFPATLIRGGDWDMPAGVFALVASFGPSYSSSHIGFRCARSARS